jgi:imidazolonepropionase-like amidohydrolase
LRHLFCSIKGKQIVKIEKVLTVVLAILLMTFPSFGSDTVPNKTYGFTNGKWFDGKTFKSRTMYSVNGLLTTKKPAKVDETVDLQNGFVIPPFADAHTHNLDGVFNLKNVINAYLNEGTFYVQVLTNYATGAQQAKPFFNKPGALDVIYANGGLTSTLGHPFLAYEPRALGFFNPADWNANMEKIKLGRKGENDVYWFFDSKSYVDEKWDKFLAQKPDVVKIFLLDAENYETLAKNGKAGDKGLSPEVAEYVVKKAHAAGLRVLAHIETANDFRLGLKIGVDGFAHAPYYGWDGEEESRPKDDLTLADIKLAAAKKVVVIPTAQIGRIEATNYSSDGTQAIDRERFARVVERQKRLFNVMRQNGVTVAFGSDYYGRTLGQELWYLSDNQIFDNLTLLKIASETTPQTIFPNRKIGKLQNGYEANFLVLKNNPLENFAAVKDISLRFKQGHFIQTEAKQKESN